jgi:predicted RNA methylase
MTYYDDLTKDQRRVSIFKEAIVQKAYGITYDLGTGSGILASFASPYAKKVYAFEINPLVIKRYSKELLKNFGNIILIEADLTSYVYVEKPDVVICEMLDTALIDEEQVQVINNVLEYTKENTTFIPKSTYDTIQVGYSNILNITYKEDDNIQFNSLSKEVKYNCVDFSNKINPEFEEDITVTIDNSGEINSLLITTYTCVSEGLITGPTPMLNPPLLIPVNKINVSKGDIVIIDLKYVMGGGLNTIKANIRRIV